MVSGRLWPMTERPKRPDVPLTGGEREILEGLLDYHRATVVWKSSGLTVDQARQKHLPSELTTIAGLVAHLTLNEFYWFSVVLDGKEDTWEPILEKDPDAEFRIPEGATMEQLLADYDAECARSREVIAKLDLGHVVPFRDREVNVRWVIAHMVEETARHVGHLDLLRELTDGLTGE